MGKSLRKKHNFITIVTSVCVCMFIRRPTLNRDARWYIFKPKIQICVNFGSSCNGRCWYMLWPFGIFFGHLVYFLVIWFIFWSFGMYIFVIWYISWSFGIFLVIWYIFCHLVYFFPLGYVVTRKIWQP
jgi:hypothetical protein